MSRRENINRQRQLIGVAMAAVMIMFMAVVVMVGITEKTYAADRLEIKRVDLTVKPVKCGTEVTVDGTEGDYYDDAHQSPAPEITAETTGIYLEQAEYCPEEGPFFWNSGEVKRDLRMADLFSGQIKAGANCWVGVGFDVEEPYYLPYSFDWDEETHTETYIPKYEVYVNGKPVDVNYLFSGVRIIRIKLNDTMIEHDWDEGKETTPPTATQPGVKTYTCKGCGATKTEAIPAKGGSDGLPMVKMTAKGKKALNISWTKVDNADGYDIFLSKCNWKDDKYTPKHVKTIMGNSTFKWTKKKGLKKKTAYKSYVRAFVMKDGTKTYVSKTPIVHAYTSGGDRTYTNPKSVKVDSTSVTLNAGQTSPIKASVKKVKSGKKLIKKNHAPKLRYYSDNEKVAKASGGTIQAVSAGTCNVYAMAANGVRATIIVTVK